MEWFIHIGTEKTGSSHIQSILALSRDYLARSGFAFPHGWSHDERCMRNGRISAGNARSLAIALNDSNETAARKQIALARKAATRTRGSRIVLSSEWLLSSLTDGNSARRLVTLLDEAGATSISLLLVLRNPLDQMLSLYKHRAKRGTAGTIEQWATSGYQLPLDLAALRSHLDDLGAEVVIRGHRKVPGALERLFFDDWLGLPAPDVSLPTAVNPSLTLSELALIRQMAYIRPELVVPLYDALAEVAPADKTQGEALAAHARAVAAQAVAEHADEWSIWNKRLPTTEQLVIPERPSHMPPAPKELGLSERQMQAISDFLGRASTLLFILKVFWRSRIRPALGRAKRLALNQ